MDAFAIKTRLEQAGTEYDRGLERFMGNAELYHKFLRKFLTDRSYLEFEQALAAGDMLVAEKSVHTLKGTVGNLSLMVLFRAADDAVQGIRAGAQGEALQKLAKHVEAEYSSSCAAIREALGE